MLTMCTHRSAEVIAESGKQETVDRYANQGVQYHEHLAERRAGRNVAVSNRRADDEREEKRMVERPVVALGGRINVNIVAAQIVHFRVDGLDDGRVFVCARNDELYGRPIIHDTFVTFESYSHFYIVCSLHVIGIKIL